MSAQTLPSTDGRPVAAASYRQDIQGLRAVAVLAVLAFHAGMPFFSGGFVGVDVFFVISGYLITGMIAREIIDTGRLRLGRFYARRARRLLPATTVVLVAIAAITLVVLPVTRWASTSGDLVASALYVVNWRFAAGAVDYLGADAAPSPVQHFWSLAVEEQFYVVWPLLILGLIALRRRLRPTMGTRATLGAGIALISAPSFVWSVLISPSDPGSAYFVTSTRLWELGLGAALALLPVRKLRHHLGRSAHLLAAGGLLAIGVAVVTFDETTTFPGYSALLPTVGAVAIIAAGSCRETGASRLLSTPAMTAIGALSYSLYLWHWPLVVGATALWADVEGRLPLHLGLAAVLASILPAWLTYTIVEQPIHRARFFAAPRRAFPLALGCTVAGVAAGLVVFAAVSGARGGEGPQGSPSGAEVIHPGQDVVVDEVAEMVPGVLEAPGDMGGLAGELCIADFAGTQAAECTYGSERAEVQIAVVGDSKMHQWLPAIEIVARQQGWRVSTSLKNACPLTRAPMNTQGGGVYEDCAVLNEDRYADLLADPELDYVLVSQRDVQAFLPDASDEEARSVLVEDMRQTWALLEDAGKDVIVVLDNPAPPGNTLDCVAANPTRLSQCAFDRDQGLAESAAAVQSEALSLSPGVTVVDLTDGICPGEVCPAVIGNVLVYRNGTHLTATYVKTLAPLLKSKLRDAM